MPKTAQKKQERPHVKWRRATPMQKVEIALFKAEKELKHIAQIYNQPRPILIAQYCRLARAALAAAKE